MNDSIREFGVENIPLLGEIPDSPKKLYIRGEFPIAKKYLTVVGSRAYTPYGKNACETLIKSLRGLPVVIVSGLALGIDSIAHEEAIASRLTTIAIPGSGLLDSVLYPRSHRLLAKRIIKEGGCLLSEFEPDFKATAWGFPQRNRIMAGLSHAVLVIEAELKSGTLITSKYATDYNRDVFAVPGSIFSKKSEGPHMLIRLGATPITSGNELQMALGFENTENQKVPLNLDNFSDEERKVITALSSPKNREELLNETSYSVTKLSSVISLLEIKGVIKESAGKIYLT